MLNFTTFFFGIRDVHLTKDPGTIPEVMHNCYGCNSGIALWDDQDYPSLKGKNLCQYYIHSGSNELGKRLNSIKWLKNNAKKIDVLHLYFWGLWTSVYIYVYKKYNKNGLIYVHLDWDGDIMDKQSSFVRTSEKTLLSKKKCHDILWGLQNYQYLNKWKGKWPFINMTYIPNGFHWEQDIPYIPFEKRNDVILTVARNGTEQKQTNILMNGFAAVSEEFPDWKLVLAGTVEDSFKPFIDQYFIDHPELRDRVEFLGPINDRNVLQKLYATSKIFALPSAWEGFGLVTVEALSEGCYVVESDIPANIDITKNGRYGRLFKTLDENDFIEKLFESLRQPDEMCRVSKDGYDYVNENYTWEKVLKPVDEWIVKKIAEKEVEGRKR